MDCHYPFILSIVPTNLPTNPKASLPITFVFLPAHDIAKFVSLGRVDLGITGQDVIQEAGVDVVEVLEYVFLLERVLSITPFCIEFDSIGCTHPH